MVGYNEFVGRAKWRDPVPDPPRVVHVPAVLVVAVNIRPVPARRQFEAMTYTANVINSTNNHLLVVWTRYPEMPPDDLDLADPSYPDRLPPTPGAVYILADVGRPTERVLALASIIREGEPQGSWQA
jgi:hypothetical protein